MALDVEATLKDLGFSEAEVAELKPKFEGERAKKLEGMVLRQSDYSRQMNELSKQQKALQEANERLNAELADWASVQASGRAQTDQQRKDLEKAQQDVLRLTQVVNRVAQEAGLDPAKVLEGTVVTPPKEPEKPPAVDLSGVVPRDQFAQFARSSMHLPAELLAIADEHFELFGKRLDTREIIKELEARASTRGNTKSLNPREIWEEQHGVPTKRQEVTQAQRAAELRAAEEKGYERARTEQALPGQMPPGRHAPLFKHLGGEDRKSALQRPQPGETVRAAVAALHSGKYRTPAK